LIALPYGLAIGVLTGLPAVGVFTSILPAPVIALPARNPVLIGVTAWMGLCLLDWSAWRRLPA